MRQGKKKYIQPNYYQCVLYNLCMKKNLVINN